MSTTAPPPSSGVGERAEFLPALRRQLWVPLLCAVLAAVGAHLVATRQAPEYDATAFLRIGDPAVVKDALGIGQGTPILNQLAATPAEVHQRRTARRAADLLEPDLRLTPAEILATTKASVDGSRALVAVSARADDPEDAARIANSMARAYLDVGPRRDLRRIRRARVQLERLARTRSRSATENLGALSGLAALQERIDHLRIIGAVHPQGVTLAQAAGPPLTPSGPSATMIALLGAAVGFVVGVAIVPLRSSFRKRRFQEARLPGAGLGPAAPPTGHRSGR